MDDHRKGLDALIEAALEISRQENEWKAQLREAILRDDRPEILRVCRLLVGLD